MWGPAEGAFQSALPLRGATSFSNASAVILLFQSALPLRGATACPEPWYRKCRYFNPRSPCGERQTQLHCVPIAHNFNPRSPCGERLKPAGLNTRSIVISIRAPLAGSDRLKHVLVQIEDRFQSALPLRGATRAGADRRPLLRISIRAPLAGSDREAPEGAPGQCISIRAPLAGSDTSTRYMSWYAEFQSALPLRGATAPCPKVEADPVISIRAPLAGSDLAKTKAEKDAVISIRAPLAGSDLAGCSVPSKCSISIRAPLAGSDIATAATFHESRSFQSALPLRGAT